MIRVNSELIVKEEEELEKAVASELKKSKDKDKDIKEVLDGHTEENGEGS